MFTHCLVNIYECLLPNTCPYSKASIFVCVSGCHVACYPLRTQQQFWTYTVQSLLTGPQPATLVFWTNTVQSLLPGQQPVTLVFWTNTVQALLTGPQPVTLCSGQTPCSSCYPDRSQSLCVLDNHRAVLATRSAASHYVE
jgi:hypothetical protein